MERVAGIVAMKDNLVTREAAPPRDLQQQPHLLRWNPSEEPPLHPTSLCQDRDIRSVVEMRDAVDAPS
jgi:hypothetical protein